MGTPAKLRIIFGDDDIRKLILPAGIPSSLTDLICAIRDSFDIPGDFSVLYQDIDFNGQFFTLTSIGDVEDKSTLKVVPVKPVVLNLSPVEEMAFDSSPPQESSDTVSTHSSSDTIILSSPDEGTTSRRSQPWPARFQIPTFSFDVEQHLQAGNQAFLKDGALLNNPSLISSILEKLAEVVFGYSAYPTGIQILTVVEALIEKFPCLREPGSFNGLYGWQQRMKWKMGNYRAKLRGRQLACPELEVNSLKRQRSNESGSNKGIKKPKKAEVNYLPPLPIGDTEATLEKERVDMLQEIKKKNNERIISEKMERSFSIRRQEVVKQCPAIQDFRERWPALFSEAQIKEEFKRITTFPLERTFLTKLDFYTPKMQEIFSKKGGVAGTKIRPLLDSLSQRHVEARREAIIRALMEFLGESSGELIKDYKDISREAAQEDQAGQVLRICVFHTCEEDEGASNADVSIVVEGTEKASFIRKQQEGETLQEFSLALMALMERLKQLVCRQPTYTLLDVRTEAIQWEREGLPSGIPGRSQSVPSICMVSSMVFKVAPRVLLLHQCLTGVR
ncbi:uncharacterized protein LOC143339324 [Chaetodon auriga]|uniref:uncharacterized protein LOC143339324 n=1 Tax=Chaetodon auriga TaxID=39042 RepID=UPI004032A420